MPTTSSQWQYVPLGELGQEVRESLRPVAGSRYELYSVPAFAVGLPEVVDGGEVGSSKRTVQPGDLLLCKINPRINRVWSVEAGNGLPQLASSEYLALRLHDKDLLKWLTWYLRSPAFRAWIKLNVEGATGSHTRAKSPAILEQRVPIAPPGERNRIVESLERTATRIEAADQLMGSAARRLIAYRHSVWDALLAQSGSIEWDWTTLQELSSDSDYGTSQKTLVDADGPPVLRIPNVVGGRIDATDLKRATIPGQLRAATALRPGDMLIVRTNGSRSLIGRGAVVMTDFLGNHFHASYLIRYRLRGNPSLWRWIGLVWNSPPVRRQIEAIAATSAGQYNISLRGLATIELPVPRHREIGSLADDLERQMSIAEVLAHEVDAIRERAQTLRDLTLRQAFAPDDSLVEAIVQ